MNYEEFLSYVRKKVQEILGDSARVELHHILKNNSVAKDGLLILEEGRSISPTIYLNSFYEAYELGTTMPEVISDVLKAYRQNQITADPEPEFYRDFSQIAGKVACKLINYDRNREMLKRTPHFRYLDLAAVCYYLVDHKIFGKGSIQISLEHVEMWEISEKELLENAKENTLKLLSWEMQSIGELFQSFGYQFGIPKRELSFPMYILSNKEKTLGAAVILYDQVLKTAGEEIGSDYYVLPSSIHECMLVPDSITAEKEELAAMVRSINAEQVPSEEILSENVYHYHRKSHLLTL